MSCKTLLTLSISCATYLSSACPRREPMKIAMNPIPKPSPRDTIIALGSNLTGLWGDPQHTLKIAVCRIGAAGIVVKFASDIVRSTALGGGRQPHFFNAVIIVHANLAPGQLLRFFKSLEREAGRRLGRRWGPRSLDLDIVAQAGYHRRQTDARRSRGQLVLPHPHMHQRAFVLGPLCQIAPHWYHPILHRTARQLLAERSIQLQLHGMETLHGTSRLLIEAAQDHDECDPKVSSIGR